MFKEKIIVKPLIALEAEIEKQTVEQLMCSISLLGICLNANVKVYLKYSHYTSKEIIVDYISDKTGLEITLSAHPYIKNGLIETRDMYYKLLEEYLFRGL